MCFNHHSVIIRIKVRRPKMLINTCMCNVLSYVQRSPARASPSRAPPAHEPGRARPLHEQPKRGRDLHEPKRVASRGASGVRRAAALARRRGSAAQPLEQCALPAQTGILVSNVRWARGDGSAHAGTAGSPIHCDGAQPRARGQSAGRRRTRDSKRVRSAKWPGERSVRTAARPILSDPPL